MCKFRDSCGNCLWAFLFSFTKYKSDSFNALTVLTLPNQELPTTILPVLLMSLGRLIAHVAPYKATCSLSYMTSLPSNISNLIAVFDLASAISFTLLLIGHGFFYLEFTLNGYHSSKGIFAIK